MDLLPTAFLFRFALPIGHAPDLPRALGWPMGDGLSAVPLFSALDTADEKVALTLAWNETGIGVRLDVHGKSRPPVARPPDLRGDGLTLWIDTRDARGAHRASRYCHEFALAPQVGRGRTYQPKIIKREIILAREQSAPMTTNPQIHSAPHPDGYRLEVWLPAQELHGFDPEQAPRIGFHAIIHDRELGECPLTVGSDMSADRDPSLWTTLELVKE